MKKLKLISTILGIVFSAQAAFAVPAQVLIIRHGEKIDDINPHLSAKGKARAIKLAKMFLKDERFNQFGPPVAVYAASPKTDDSSVRPQETVTPLARALGQKIILRYNKKEFAELSEAIYNDPAYNGRTVVIAWVRQTIPDLASAFYATGVPKKWDDGAFDRVWQIKFKDGRNAGRLHDLPQHLFPSDSAE